jgi:hypothetical protein
MAKFTFDHGALYVSGLDGEPIAKHHVVSEDGQPCRFDGTHSGEWAVFQPGSFAILVGCQVYRFQIGAETADSVAYRAGWEKAAKQKRQVCPKAFATDAERDGWVDCWAAKKAA